MINTIDARVWNGTRLAVPDHDGSDDAHANVSDAARADLTIPDATAVTIASWWQTERGTGAAFAELATTGMATATGIERAIDDVLATDSPAPDDVDALYALRRWVREHPSRQHVDYPHPAGHLYDCPACENYCWCDNLDHTTPCVHCAANESNGCRVDENRCRAHPFG